MKSTLALVAAGLLVSGCTWAGPAAPVVIDAGRAFSLRPGQSAATRDDATRVGFVGVISDSRCAKGERCVWAGDAVVRVWVQRVGGPQDFHELHTSPRPAQAASARDAPLQLLRLEPHPIAGRAAEPAEAVATLMLTDPSAATAGDPDR